MTHPIENILDTQVSARIKDIGRLATLPQVTWELMRLLSNEATTPDDLQKVVEQDPALSAKVISLGNSAYYGLRTPAATISRAIMVIGFRELEFLAMGLGLADTFDLREVPHGFDGEALWLHSLSVAWTAREVAAVTRLVDPGEAMLAGLLHNIGQIMMVTHFTVQLQKLMNCVEADGYSFAEAEVHLGLWHEVIGFLLARNWGMPKYLEDVILYHHRPEAASSSKVTVEVVNIAVRLVDQTEFRLDYEEFYHDTAVAGGVLMERMTTEEKDKLLDKMAVTLPLMAPTWLQMLGPVRKKENIH